MTAVEGVVETPGETAEVDDLQRMYAETAGKPYTFTWADRQWTLPHIKELDFELQTELEGFSPSGSDAEAVNVLFDKLLGPDQGTQWRQVVRPLHFLFMLLERWMTHCGVAPGESEASDTSSPSTRRPSKQTSTASTASASRRRSAAKKATPVKAATRRASS